MFSSKKLLTTCGLSLVCFWSCASSGVDSSATANNAPASAVVTTSIESFGFEQGSDDALSAARRLDRTERTPDGKLATLTADEHLRRAGVYHLNRAFGEARQHYQAVVDRYPNDPRVPAAMFGIGRTFYQERKYADALPVFEKLGNTFANVKEGREGFYYVAPTLLRMERAGEAAARYQLYTERFPQGERIQDAYLNVIDSLREAGRAADALAWVARARERFRNQPTETNALFTSLRLALATRDWQAAITVTDELLRGDLLRRASFPEISTTPGEVAYLRAYAFEQMSRADEARVGFQNISDTARSYYGAQATARLEKDQRTRSLAGIRTSAVRRENMRVAGEYPAPFREQILRAANKRSIDPRFVLSLMRQESGFRPQARSPAAARGLLQLTYDTALKYAARAGYNNLTENDLYRTEVSIEIGCEYVADLMRQFPGMYEAVAASYNGGEDNAARWLKRANTRDAGVFTSEVGFSETKDYVQKVLANYRAYTQLYTNDLRPR